MKTTEQIKSEVVSYLNKTSNHLFVNEKGEFYKVLVEGNNFIVIDGDRVTVYDIDQYISWYGGNTKCVIKHRLFLGKKLKSIKNFKAMKEKCNLIKSAISGKTDKVEINKIVNSMMTTVTIVTEDVTKGEKKSFISRLFCK